MCLISISPKGTDKYSEFFLKALKTGSISNTDGMGFAYKKHNEERIFISKGYFTIKTLTDALKECNLEENDELIVHQRIGTSGKVDAENCHPFVISDKQEEIITTDGFIEKPIVAHNGIFYDFSIKHSIFSDTYHFVHLMLSYPHISNFLKEDVEGFENLLNTLGILSNNKLALLYPDKGLVVTSGFTSDNGYLFSNKGYVSYGYRNVGGREEEVEEVKDEKPKFSLIVPNEPIIDEKEEDSENETIGGNFMEHNNNGLLSGLKSALEHWFGASNKDSPSLKVMIHGNNYDEFIIICKKQVKSFIKGDTLTITKFESAESIFVHDPKDSMVLESLTREQITDNFNIYARKDSARKYAELKKMMDTYNDVSGNFYKKLNNVLARSSKKVLEIGGKGHWNRDVVEEFKNQMSILILNKEKV